MRQPANAKRDGAGRLRRVAAGLFARLWRRGWWHRRLLWLVRLAHGALKPLWISIIVVLVVCWIGLGWLAIIRSPDFTALGLSGLDAHTETLYRLFRMVGGSDLYAAGQAWELTGWGGARLAGLALPFWIAVPPLFVWLLRAGERGAARRVLSGHYVILGCGQVGAALARDLLRADGPHRPVVIVDNAADQARLEVLRRMGAIVFEQDAQIIEKASKRINLARDLAAYRAAGILVATGSSSRNIDIAGRLAAEIARIRRSLGLSGRHSPCPRIVPHIPEHGLMAWAAMPANSRWLKGAESVAEDDCRPEIWPFSADQAAVRKLLAERTIASYAALRGLRRPHIVILGHDSVAEWLLPQVFQAALAQHPDRPLVTIVLDTGSGSVGLARVEHLLREKYAFLLAGDDDAAAREAWPGIELRLCKYNFDHLGADLFELAGRAGEFALDLGRKLAGDIAIAATVDAEIKEWALDKLAAGEDPVTTVFVCFGNDNRNLDIALRLQQLAHQQRRWLAPIFARLYRDSGLQDVLSRCERQAKLDWVIDDFGQDDQVCTRSEIFESPRDAAAQEAHRVYQFGELLTRLARALQQQGEAPPDRTRDWDDFFREHGRALSRDWQPGDGQIPVPSAAAMAAWLAKPPEGRADDDAWSRRERALRALLDLLETGKPPRSERTRTASEAWQRLHLEYVVSNRDQVDHLPVKLRALGYRDRTPSPGDSAACSKLQGPWPISNRWQGHAVAFRLASGEQFDASVLPREIQTMARCEHDRWSVEKLLNGWRFGPARDNARRLHPSLLPYEKLDKMPAERRKDELSVLNIHDVLAKSVPVRRWWPECSVGVIGPQWGTGVDGDPDPGAVREEALKHAVGAVLEAIIAIEAEVLEAQFSSILDTEARQARMTRDMMALCCVSSLDRGAGICGAEAARDWARKGRSAGAGSPPFRLVVPRLAPLPAAGAGRDSWAQRVHRLLGQDRMDAQQDDCWEIDLLPEGIPLAAIEDDMPRWPPGQNGSTQAGADFQEQLRRLREHARSDLLMPCLAAYLAECTDWLILVSVPAMADDPLVLEADRRRRETRPESQRPRQSGDEALATQVLSGMAGWERAGDGCMDLRQLPPGCSTVRIRAAHRLVEITLSG